MESEYFIYYKTNENIFRVWSSKTETISIHTYADKPLIQCFEMINITKEYEATDESLLKYVINFKIWIHELKHNDVFSINWVDNKIPFFNNNVAIKMIFNHMSKSSSKHHKPIRKIEAGWMNKTYNGALLYCKPTTINTYSYDYTSFYPKNLSSKQLLIPNSEGKEYILSELPNIADIQTGFYRVNISCENDDFRKLFSFSQEDTYLDKSLYQAMKYQKQYDIKIELIQDGEANAYLYNNDVLETGDKIFGKWYKIIKQLRDIYPKNVLLKFLSSSLSGQLSKRKKLTRTHEEAINEKLDIGMYDNHKYMIYDLKMYTRDNVEYEYYELLEVDEQFSSNLRIMPFLTAYSRNKTSRLVMKDINSVIRIHTDCVSFSKPQIFTKLDNQLDYNSLKFEEKSSGLIMWKNINNYLNYDYLLTKMKIQSNLMMNQFNSLKLLISS